MRKSYITTPIATIALLLGGACAELAAQSTGTYTGNDGRTVTVTVSADGNTITITPTSGGRATTYTKQQVREGRGDRGGSGGGSAVSTGTAVSTTGGFMLQTTRATGDSQGFMTLNAAGTAPITGTRGSAKFVDSQALFTLEDAGDGWSRIKTSTGGYLRLSTADKDKTVDIASRADRTNNFKFRIEDTGDGDGSVYIRSALKDNWYLGTRYNSASDNTVIIANNTKTKWRNVRSRR